MLLRAASIASASRSLVTICSGVCLVHFMLKGCRLQPAAVGTLIGLDQALRGTSNANSEGDNSRHGGLEGILQEL